MNSALFLHRRRRQAQGGQGVPRSALLTEGSTLDGNGGIVGYWMLPKGGGKYAKLKIYQSYTVKVNGLLPNFKDLLSTRFFSALRGHDSFDVNIDLDGRLLPIWPIVCNSLVLSKHFPFIQELVEKHPDVFNPKSGGFLRDAVSIQGVLIKRGFSFYVKAGTTALFAGVDQGVMRTWVAELFRKDVMNPVTVLVGDSSSVRQVQLVSPSGDVTSKEYPLKQLASSLAGDTEEGEETFASYINKTLGSANAIAHSEFIPGFTKHPWKSAKDWEEIDPAIVIRHFNKETFGKALKKVEGSHQISNGLIAALSAAFEFIEAAGMSIERDLGWTEEDGETVREILNEASFKSLLQATSSNGDYLIGGMRRVGRIWVYDRDVRGRVANARFVVTTRPRLILDEDGCPSYRFVFRSRPDRNTTGMAHHGYIKFPDEAGPVRMLDRIKSFFREEIDLNVHVGCSCPDFKFKWHWVLHKGGSSHYPSGAGFDAMDSPPNRTNPDRRIGMCKHLVAAKDFLLLSAREHYEQVRKLKKGSPIASGKPDDPKDAVLKPGVNLSESLLNG